MNAALLLVIYRENRRLALVTAVFLVCSIVVVALAVQRQDTLARLQTSWAEKRRQAALKNQATVRSSYQQAEASLNKVLAHLPARFEFPRVLGQLTDLAAASGVTLGGMSYKPQKAPFDGILVYSLHCSAAGNYGALKRFLTELQALDGLATVDQVGLTNPDPFEVKAVMELGLSIHLRESRP